MITERISGIAASLSQRSLTSLCAAWIQISTTFGAPTLATLVTAVSRIRLSCSSRLMRLRIVPSVTPSSAAMRRLLTRASFDSTPMMR